MAHSLSDADIAAPLKPPASRVFCDEAMPAQARERLDRMPTALTRLAQADASFLLDSAHPARRLLPLMLHIALGCGHAAPGGDAHYRTLDGLVARLASDPPPDLAACAGILNDAEAFFAEENVTYSPAVQRMSDDAIRDEAHARVHAFAESEIAVRLEDGDVAGFVEDFLRNRWQQVLAPGIGVPEATPARPDVLPQWLETMDALVWSVKPKHSPEERKALLERLPALLATLNDWLEVIPWSAAERESFMASLAEHHAAAMRAQADMTSLHQLQLRMDAAQKASEYQLARRAREDRETALAGFLEVVDGLAQGSWVELVRNGGGKVNCRLLWVSPERSRLVFAAPSTRRVFVLDAETLAQALQVERARVIAVDRMLASVLAMTEERLQGA